MRRSKETNFASKEVYVIESICVYVNVCLYMCGYLCVCLFICLSLRVFLCIHASVCMCLYANLFVWVCVCTFMWARMRVSVSVSARICPLVCKYVCAYAHARVRVMESYHVDIWRIISSFCVSLWPMTLCVIMTYVCQFDFYVSLWHIFYSPTEPDNTHMFNVYCLALWVNKRYVIMTVGE